MRKIPCPITKEELDDLYTQQGLSDSAIAKHLGGDATEKRVHSWRGRFGISSIPRWARNRVDPIEGRLKSLLVGSILGDGRLVRRSNATHYIENHAENQKAYLEWKIAQWGSWVKSPMKPVTWKTNGQEYPGWRFHTCAHPDLNVYHDIFYGTKTERGCKRLIPLVVDLVDELALTIWYLDDGCVCWWPDITFGMDPDSLQIAWAIFEKFRLKPRWKRLKGNTGNFHMEREDTAERFLQIIRPHVPDCMKYKLEGFGFQGAHYKVRQKLQEDTLREMAAQGVPIKRIARHLGVGASTVSRWLEKWEIDHPRKKGRPSRERTP